MRKSGSWLRPAASLAAVLVAVGVGYLAKLESGQKEASDSSVRLGSGLFFDNLAESYDLLNRLISLGLDQSWRRAAANAALKTNSCPSETESDSSLSVLDVATGTGDLAIILARSRKFGTVVGLDPSKKSLARLSDKYPDGIRAVQGVAESLPFEDSAFDAVTVAFGVRNFEDRAKGLKEISRVLRTGGRLVVLEVSMPEGTGIVAVAARLFVSRIMPVIGGLVSGRRADYVYLSDSMSQFPSPRKFEALLQEAGFGRVWYSRLWPLGAGPKLFVAVK